MYELNVKVTLPTQQDAQRVVDEVREELCKCQVTHELGGVMCNEVYRRIRSIVQVEVSKDPITQSETVIS
ncbi:hypothetical protein C5471_18595 [Photorhabdus tasmaniensis]|uniref:Thiamine-binding protein domain-containing protein n=1 Tax=Photorhabdus tasmaniensis TaxID=1004159 RepID=A0ABX0GMM7_9GAMM|nr:hypothetical protein [Photorhabdus tasmaniensis]